MIKSKIYKLHIEFITPVLGSQPSRDIATEFLAKRNGFAIPEDEVETLPDALENMTTRFHRNGEDSPVLYDYQIKGFLKEAGRVLSGHVDGGVKSLRSKVNNLVFVSPRMIPLRLPPKNGSGEEPEMDILERPLRAETAQGPRVAIARSETMLEGTTLNCALEVLPGQVSEEVLKDILDYGFHQGLGQWRNGGWGRFRYELKPE